MKTIAVRKFKRDFARLIDEDEDILITSRKKPVGIFRPLGGKGKKALRKQIALRLIGLGQGPGGKISEDHDEVLYR